MTRMTSVGTGGEVSEAPRIRSLGKRRPSVMTLNVGDPMSERCIKGGTLRASLA